MSLHPMKTTDSEKYSSTYIIIRMSADGTEDRWSTSSFLSKTWLRISCLWISAPSVVSIQQNHKRLQHNCNYHVTRWSLVSTQCIVVWVTTFKNKIFDNTDMPGLFCNWYFKDFPLQNTHTIFYHDKSCFKKHDNKNKKLYLLKSKFY